MSVEHTDRFAEMQRCEPIPWAQIPDIGLYMDQVITLVGRACQPLYGSDIRDFLSPAMINNYVKAKLLPRPAGKKYSREQVALLSMIVPLKQVCSMEDIRALLTLREGQTVEALYNSFCSRFTDALQALRAEPGDDVPAAMDFAIRAVTCRAACSAALREKEP